MVAARLTSVSGASGAFKYGAVTYCNEAKHAVLGVSTETLDEHGEALDALIEWTDNVQEVVRVPFAKPKAVR